MSNQLFSFFPDKISNYLKHFLLVLPGQLLHEIFEEEVAVLHQEGPDDLVGHLVHRRAVPGHRVVVQQLHDLRQTGADGGWEQSLGK